MHLRSLGTLFFASALLTTFGHAIEVTPTAAGISIDAGTAGVYVLSYPRLLDPVDGGATPAPNTISVKPDHSGAVLTYLPSGKAALDKQPDGSWLYHFTEIPEDRMKFGVGLRFPPSLGGDGATWSFDGAPPSPFPKVKAELNIYRGNPKTFVFMNKQSGFVLTYPRQTWTVFNDQRVWGKDTIGYGQYFYFPGKKHVSEIDYTFRIDSLPATPVAPATTLAQPPASP